MPPPQPPRGLPLAWAFCSLWLLLPAGLAHPQCLDFKPPFRPAQQLELCVMYAEFGCCDRQKDQELLRRYYHITDNFDQHGYSRCAGMVLELLCQVGRGQRSKSHEKHAQLSPRP